MTKSLGSIAVIVGVGLLVAVSALFLAFSGNVGSMHNLPIATLELAPTQILPLNSETLRSTLSVQVPATWRQSSQPLKVTVPGRGTFAIHLPPSVQPGQTFYFQLGSGVDAAQESRIKYSARPTQLRSVRRSNPDRGLTSFSNMLAMERRIRQTMGNIHHTWKDNPRSFAKAKRWVQAAGSMLAATADGDADFIPYEVAPKAPGWNPANPNGFPAGPPDQLNINGVPGYTFTTDGTTLDVADQGPGYYQPVDPEHDPAYLALIKNDCYTAPGQPWTDHSNCASLLQRSHTYPNSDPWRFSGAFGWNPPFPEAANATNVQGAFAPDENEYWNYGSDSDRASALQWDGTAYVDPAKAAAAAAAAQAAKDAAEAAAAAAAAPPPPANATASAAAEPAAEGAAPAAAAAAVPSAGEAAAEGAAEAAAPAAANATVA